MSFHERALLVQLGISQWTARALDRKATEQVAEANSTTTAAGRYNKVLLPNNEYLAAVHKKTTVIRTEYYDNTLPWGIEGTQLLPSKNYFAFMESFRTHKYQWERMVDEFVSHYESLRSKARGFLAGLYNPNDYPDASVVRRKFKMDLAVFPVPASDFRVALNNQEVERIQKDVERRVNEAAASAMREVWQRLYDRVQAMSEKLKDPSAIFRDSLVENARETCELLTRLNVMSDPDLEALRKEVADKLASHHPDKLRNDLDLRRKTADTAQQIMDRMAAFMGGTT